MDYQLFGLNAGPQHIVNVVFHIGGALLLFLALVRMTGLPWRCAFVAGIFALHPLHVESVAWVSERKDVLSTFFQMLTLLLYARYTEDPKPTRYWVMALSYALSLLAKPMAVTLPFVLLLLDFWPLGRLELQSWRPNLKRLVREKVWLFAVSAAACVVTLFAQKAGLIPLGHAPVTARLANASASYVMYLVKAVAPVRLAVLYPFRQWPFSFVFASTIILAAISAAVVTLRRRHPYLLVGWLWYLGTLVPVIGLVQVGYQSMADRYTYVPLVGISIAVAWVVADTVERWSRVRSAAGILGIVAVAISGALAHHQAAYWQDSNTLFEHTLAVTKDNVVTQNNLAVVLYHGGRRGEAAALFRKSLAVNADDAGAQNGLALILSEDGKAGEAMDLWRRALISDPNYADAHINLGRALLKSGQFEEALSHLNEAVSLKPQSVEAWADMGVAQAALGNFEIARLHLEHSVRLDPASAANQSNLCYVLLHLGRAEDAIAACNAALSIKPDFADALHNLENARAALAGGGGRP